MYSAYPFILCLLPLVSLCAYNFRPHASIAYIGQVEDVEGYYASAERSGHIKQYKYASKDINKLINDMVVLADRREKNGRYITDCFSKNNIAYEPATLIYGDYLFMIPAAAGQDIFFHRDIAIERKASLEELSGNLAQKRERFEKEFLRAGNDGCKVYLMVESPGGYSSIIKHDYNTQVSPASFMVSLKTWAACFDCNAQFIDGRYSGYYIVSTFKYHAREALK